MDIRPLPLNNALSQRDRRLSAPAPDSVQVDGRSLASVLGFAAEYGALLRFYDVHDQPDGDWAGFFQHDASIAAALCAALDIGDIEFELDLLLEALAGAADGEQRLAHWRTLTRGLLRLLSIVDIDAALGLSPGSALHQALPQLLTAQRIPALADAARPLLAHLEYAPAEPRLLREQTGSRWIKMLLALLEALLAALIVELERVQSDALASLAPSLQSGDHAPQSGLWDAFAQLFRHAQHSINSFPARLQRFYHEAVLRQTVRQCVPDRVALAFTPADGLAQTTLPKGATFLAGTDAESEPILYALEAALTVDAAVISGMRTVTLLEQPLALGLPLAPAQVYSGEVALADSAPMIATPFPLFGACAVGDAGALTSSLASLGFALASNSLLMAGGTRTVTLTLTVSADSWAGILPDLTILGARANMSPETVLARILTVGFMLRYTTPDGWADVPTYTVQPATPADRNYQLQYILPIAASASAPFADQAAEFGGMPVLLATLVQERLPLRAPVTSQLTETYVFPYAILSRLSLESIGLQVAVAGLTELQLTGPGGPLDPAQPFTLFGSPPVAGAALTVAAPELFAKRLTTCELTINWFGLPATKDGFKGYYENYIINENGETCKPGTLFDNAAFKVNVTVLNPGAWQVEKEQQQLFSPDKGTPSQKTVLDMGPTPEPLPVIYDPTLSAMQVVLATPSYAFGDVLYAPNVMAASLALTSAAAVEACKKAGCGEQLECPPSPAPAPTPGPTPATTPTPTPTPAPLAFPNQPWLPQAQGLSVDYSASATPDSVAPLHWFHLQAFGEITPQPWPTEGGQALLQPLPDTATLDISLSAPASAISVLFELVPPAGGWPGSLPTPSWRYSTNGVSNWQPLQLVRDASNGLRQTGIIRFLVPPDAAPQYLRVSLGKGDPSQYPLLSALWMNAAYAVWQGPGGARQLGTPLPSGSISSADPALDTLGDIVQPAPSAGGRAEATGAAFDQWIAERLRHKEVAIQAWDYANLLLDAFPSLWQVAVIPASGNGAMPRAGQVWITPVPGPDTPAVDDATCPSNSGQMLAAISDFLAARSSPFIELSVSNPPYTRLQVVAELLFVAGEHEADCISRLNTELISWLSPWPATDTRSTRYYTRPEIANFIRQRPYVKAILKLAVTGAETGQVAYYTSALKHALSGRVDTSQALGRGAAT
ncbi:hypothetical protein KW842_02925 [Duganella sp. sic0402]|uniref:hypothetical protein n=1 Tax=Duganella sp. sic0402 TaxID=2854786 RepID=UPI001C496513|nr:hypothetical protein [Duganella sp. sic0402]MBV7534711.1 hypothetical protein [Duganella sp. sic0402]